MKALSLKVCIATLVTALCQFGQAQVNSWTSPASGNWEDPSWSLGVSPASTHWVMVTNAQSKAVAIFPSTPINTRTISNLTVSAPSGYANTVLLNFSGFGSPLKVLNEANILDRGSLNNQFGSFVVGTNCLVMNANMVHESGSWFVTNGSTTFVNSTGSFARSQCALKNAAAYNNSFLTQTGGVFDATLGLYDSTYVLSNGIFQGSLTLGDFGIQVFTGNLYQTGGTNSANTYVSKGTYKLLNGTFLGTIGMGREGNFYQTNSVVNAPSVDLGSYQFGSRYAVTNGTNRFGSLSIGSGTYTQNGGTLFVTNGMSVVGHFDSYGPVWFAHYELNPGVVDCATVSLGRFGDFSHIAGTNRVRSELNLNQGHYILTAGSVQTLNTVVAPNFPYDVDITFPSRFDHNAGTHIVTNTLTIQGNYALLGGTISAPTIVLGNSRDSAFTISGATPVVVNSGLFSAGGRLRLQGSTQQLGKLVLSDNATFDFASTAGQLKFLTSSGVPWTNGVTLVISNWIGLATGNGANRFVVGTDATGLASAQLGQIRFINPSGFSPGTYYADILATGEVVPTVRPHLLASKLAGKIIFNWPAGFTLESSTNAQGPFFTVPSVTPPYTNVFTEPRRFFRVKSP